MYTVWHNILYSAVLLFISNTTNKTIEVFIVLQYLSYFSVYHYTIPLSYWKHRQKGRFLNNNNNNNYNLYCANSIYDMIKSASQ
jgi:hypothetical protein